MSNNITNKQALSAYNKLKEYCKQQKDCNGCLFVTEEDFCLHVVEPSHPEDWQDLEL